MRKLWVVVRREYAERVRTKWFLFATLFGPISMAVTLFLPGYLSRRTAPPPGATTAIRILDATPNGLGTLLVTDLGGGIAGDPSKAQLLTLREEALPAAESLATEAVRQRQLRGYLVLDRDRSGTMRARYAGRNATSLVETERIRAVFTRHLLALRMTTNGLHPDVASRIARSPSPFSVERITDEGRGGSGSVSLLFAIGVSVLLYLTLLMYGQNVLRGVMDEKQSRVAEMVVSSVRPDVLLTGKVFGIGAVGLTQIMVWIATSLLMLKYRVAVLGLLGAAARPLALPQVTLGTAILLIVFFMLGYLLYAALFAMVGAMVSSEQEAQQAQIPVVMLLVLSILFLQPVLTAPDGSLAITLSLTPFSAPVVMPLRMSAGSVPWWEVSLSLLALASAGYLALFIASRVYRTGILLYGKRPRLREVLRWIGRSGA
jgi:ABC-2 type transport system permease protein